MALLKQLGSMVDTGQVGRKEAARIVASSMFIPGVDKDPLREEITIVAGDLEEGDRVVLSQRHTWDYLLELIDELDRGASRRPHQ